MQVLGRTYSKTIIWQGDPNAAPVSNGGPVPTTIIARPVQFLPWRSTAITRIGDPNAAPVSPGTTAAPLVVTSLPQVPVKGVAILSAAAADFAFSGPLVSTPPAQTPAMVAPIIARQLQDGFIPPTGGAVPLSLVASTFPRPWVAPTIIALTAAPASVATVPTATPAPFVITRPRDKTQRWQIIVTQAPIVSGAAPVTPRPLRPTSLLFDVHQAGSLLDAHSTGTLLDAHATATAFDVHATGTLLDVHATAIALAAHQSDIALDSHQTGLLFDN